MKNTTKAFVLSALTAATMLTSCGASSQKKQVTLSNEVDSASYVLGVMLGTNIREEIQKQLGSFNNDAFDAAVRLALSNDTANLKFEPMQAQMILRDIMTRKQQALAAKNLEEGKKFLEENAKKDGVVALPNGLQYIVLEEGTGEKPTADDVVEVDYVGTLIDGTEFDSSIKRGQPAKFPLKGVIPGWTEILQLMPVGSKWKVFIPAELAYGERTSGPIPGNSTLIFEITLHQIVKQEAPKDNADDKGKK